MIVSLIAKIAGENSIFEKCASHLLEILDSDSDKFSINLIRLLTAKQSENSCEVIVSKTTQCPHSAHECISMALIVLDANLSSCEHLLREASIDYGISKLLAIYGKKRSWTLDAAKESMPQEVKDHEMKTKVETSSFFCRSISKN